MQAEGVVLDTELVLVREKPLCDGCNTADLRRKRRDEADPTALLRHALPRC